ncbi:MAG TPA: hypothetical protein VGC22_07255 [Chitinophaga sp.]
MPDVQLPARHDFSLSFDLSFAPQSPSYFGYVFRLIDDKDQNIDLIYDRHAHALQLVTGNEFSGINYPLEPGARSHEWKHILLTLSRNTRQVSLWSNGQLIGRAPVNMVLGRSIKLLFGANHDGSFKNIDLPPMRLRDVKVWHGKSLYHHFALAQRAGLCDTDLVHGKIAYVEHPVWLQPRYHNWQPKGSWTLKGNTSIAFDGNSGTVYITGQDTLLAINVAQQLQKSIPLAQPTGAPPGNLSLYDEQHGQLYNFFPDNPAVGVFDTLQRRWSHPLDSGCVTRFWHPALFYAASDSAMYVIGGYGDYQYKNTLRRYHPATACWDTPSVTGERFTPRYLSAVGTNRRGDTAYILGGYGSLQGEQLLNPHNLYDLTVYDVKKRSFKKIFTLPKPAAPFSFAGTLVIDSAQQAGFTLAFANDRMQSSLQLVQVSLHQPVYQRLGSLIDFPFIDTRADAALYYCAQTGELVAVAYYSPDNIVTTVKIYTLLMPVNIPQPQDRHSFWSPVPATVRAIGAVLFLLVTGLAGLYILRRRKAASLLPPATTVAMPSILPTEEPAAQPVAAPLPVNVQTIVIKAPVPPQPAPVAALPGAAIHLFGRFTVLDKAGEDISRLFSPLVKELFLLILLPNITGQPGITSEKMSEILWPNMTPAAAKNNRSVNIAKLRGILEKIGDYTLIKEKGRWQLLLNENSIHIDLLTWRQLPAITKDHTAHIQLLKRGSFLEGLEYSWLDTYKHAVNQQVITQLDDYLQAHADTTAPAMVIDLCDCLLHFDALSEEAVIHKCRALVQLHQHASARKLYERFQEEYEAIYGEKFEQEYARVVAGAVH